MSANQPMAALDNLRTVEFRQTLRGYHIDDVDEYLEKVAVEAEALREQMRQQAERMRQATERITQLEQDQHQQPQAVAAAAMSSAAAEDTLQRTLVMAQKFVDQTHAEAEAEARSLVEQAQERATKTLADAENQAKTLVEQAQIRLREDVARLEALRGKLAGDVETISHYLDAERTRLRGFLGEMQRWVDENVQPTANVSAKPAAERQSDDNGPARVQQPPVNAQVSSSAGPATPGGSSGGMTGAPDPTPAPQSDPSATPRQGLMSLGGQGNRIQR